MVYFILLLVLIAVVLAYAASKPDTFRYERSTLISTSPERIFPYLNNTRKASEWSPWEKHDPDMKKVYAGPEEGVGAKFAWDGNKNVGAGNLEIIRSVPNEIVVMDLEFLRPFKASNKAEYILEPQAGGTLVTWAMYGPNTFIGKLMSVFINCDKMCGREFEKGLATLKLLTEPGSAVPPVGTL